MTDIKMSNTFDLPVSDGDFTLVAMNKSTYVSMDRAAVIAINSYDLNQEHIAELEKELATSTPPPNLVWFERSDVLGLDQQQTGVIDLRKFALKQQAKGLTDYAKEQEQGLNALWMIAAASKLIDQAKALKEQGK